MDGSSHDRLEAESSLRLPLADRSARPSAGRGGPAPVPPHGFGHRRRRRHDRRDPSRERVGPVVLLRHRGLRRRKGRHHGARGRPRHSGGDARTPRLAPPRGRDARARDHRDGRGGRSRTARSSRCSASTRSRTRRAREYSFALSQDDSPKHKHASEASDILSIFEKDSIFVTSVFAKRNSLRPGSSLHLVANGVERTFRVAAVLRPAGAARAASGSIVFMDLAVAQEAFGKVGRLDRIDVVLPPGLSEDGPRAFRGGGPRLAASRHDRRAPGASHGDRRPPRARVSREPLRPRPDRTSRRDVLRLQHALHLGPEASHGHRHGPGARGLEAVRVHRVPRRGTRARRPRKRGRRRSRRGAREGRAPPRGRHRD